MDKNTLIGTIVGLSIAWILNSVGKWWARKKENELVKKKVLYNLLEVHYNLSMLDIEDKLDLSFTKMGKHIPAEEREQAIKDIKPAIQSIVTKAIASQVKDKLKSLSDSYSTSIEQLSAIDPIRAYWLSERSNVFEVFESLERYFSEVSDPLKESNDEFTHDEIEQSLNDIQGELVDFFEPEVFKDAIKEIRGEIEGLAWSVGIRTWYKAKRPINNIKNGISVKDEKIIDDSFQKIMSYFEERYS